MVKPTKTAKFRIPGIGLCRHSEANGLTLVVDVKMGKPSRSDNGGECQKYGGIRK